MRSVPAVWGGPQVCHDLGVWLSTAFPERIELEEVTVRIQTVEDAPALSRAILHSRDELRPWLPFANDDEAVTEDAQGQRLERVTGQWNS